MNFKRFHESKNLLNNTATDTESYGVRITINPDKSITINGRMSSGTVTYFNISSVKFTSGKKYTISGVTGYTDRTLQIFTESSTAFPAGNRLQTYDGATTRTASGNETCTIRLYVYSGVTYENVKVYPFICEGSTPQPYEPYFSEVWHNIPHYIHNTSTDTITTLPADIYANDTTATVGLKGNMQQTGTPTPATPIQPQECGERTENLFDEVYQPHVGTAVIYKPIYVGNGEFTLSTNMIKNTQVGTLFLLAGNVSSGAATGVNNVYINNPITVTSIDGYVTIGYRKYNENTPDPEDYNVMLNTGSTALPYEPYGYKIPILSGGTTTPVYLGEVQSTRQIKKLVFDGTENWLVESGTNGLYTLPNFTPLIQYNNQLCTHFSLASSYVNFYNTDLTFAIITRPAIVVHYNACQTVSAFKAFLASEYANGTPVCVWHVLATPTTTTLNEPIRMIGDYADSVSVSNIHTTGTAESFDIDTTLKPSEVQLTYHGWHEHSDTKFTE